jgi:hypothetical protein
MPRTLVLDTLKEGWTEPLDIQLYEQSTSGTRTNLNGTGFTLSDCRLVGNDDQRVVTTSKFAWLSQSDGTVRYSPASTDFKADKSPYRISFEVTDGNSKKRWHPDDVDALIHVLRV